MFSYDELKRYSRQMVLAGWGEAGQGRLKAARVLVLGCGGLGCPALMALAGAGVGTLGVADYDTVWLSNLHRQVLFTEADIGRIKAEAAVERLGMLNREVGVVPHVQLVDADNAAALVAAYDLVLDCSDNFDCRYAVSDACFHARRPLVSAAALQTFGTLTTLMPHATRPDGQPYPSYRCLYPAPPPPDLAPACASVGVVGAVTGVMGHLMALEAVKLITGLGEPLLGRLLLYDALAARFDTAVYAWNPANPLSGRAAPAANLP